MQHRSSLDANHAEIVAKLRAIGATVVDLAKVGRGCPDLLVGWRGKTYLMEIKTAKGYIRPTQEQFFRSWTGGHIAIVRSFDDALDVMTMEGS
jgi:Holliday junction resolvase